jgi:hypothetical protein
MDGYLKYNQIKKKGVKDMLHHGNKVRLLILLLFVISSCNKYVKLNEKELNEKRNLFLHTSMHIVGEKEYWNIYNQINDSIRNWENHSLKWYAESSAVVQFQVDSLLCFNAKGDKMITGRMGIGFNDDDVMDAIIHYYGVKIVNKWYFFSASIMHIPREYYQEDIHTPLSFEKLKQIATNNIYRGYLKKGKKGQWEINDAFFSDITSNAWCGDCVTQQEWDSVYISVVQRNWSKRDTINYE